MVLDYATNFLSEHLFTTESNYEQYVTEAKDYAEVQAHALDSDVAILTKQAGNKEVEYERTKATISDNPKLARHYDLDTVEAELKSLQKDLKKFVATRQQLKQSVLTYSEYLELFETIGVNLHKTHDIGVMDEGGTKVLH